MPLQRSRESPESLLGRDIMPNFRCAIASIMTHYAKIGRELGVLLMVICLTMSAMANGFKRIPFTQVNGLMMVDVEVDGHTGMFIFDTGADQVLMHGDTGRNDKSVTFDTVDGALTTTELSVDAITMGDYLLQDIIIYQADLSHLHQQVSSEILGIIGMSAFRDEVLEINHLDNTINLYSRDDLTEIDSDVYRTIPLYHNDQVSCVEVMIDGDDHLFVLDTGASISLVAQTVYDTYTSAFTSTGNVFTLNSSTGSHIDHHYYRSESLAIGDISLDGIVLGVIDLSAFPEISGIISIDALPGDSVIFDYVGDTVYIRNSPDGNAILTGEE